MIWRKSGIYIYSLLYSCDIYMNYVYYFTDFDDKIIYVGKTGNIKTRMRTHFTKGHLPDECYQSVNHIFCAETGFSQYDTEIIETILIDQYKPKYNTDKVFLERFERSNFRVPDLKWKPLYIIYANHTVDIAFTDPGYPCFNTSLFGTQRANAVLEYNLTLLKKRRGVYLHDMKDVLDAYGTQLLDSFSNFCLSVTIHPSESCTDEPLSFDDYDTAYVAFSLNSKSRQDLFPILLQVGLIFPLENNLYAIPLHTRAALQYMNQRFIAIAKKKSS